MRTNLLLCIGLMACGSDKGVTVHNSTPLVAIVSHSDGQAVTAGTEQIFSAALSDPDDPKANLVAKWTIGGREVCPAEPPDENGDSHCTHILEEADTEVRVEVRDPKNAADTDSITLVISPAENQPPDAPEVVIAPNPATTENDLVAQVSGGSDPEGSAVGFGYQWYQDNQLTSHTTDTIAAADTTKEETWRVVVTPNDGEDDGPSAEDSLVISNSDPILDAVDITDSDSVSITTASHGETITCVATWSDADGESDATVSYDWTDSSGSSWGTTAELTINLAGTGSQGGEVLTCSVVVDDGEGSPATGSASVTLDGCDPFAEETPYDGIDSNCDGLETLNDADGDGTADDSSLDYNEDGSSDLGVECAGTWAQTVYYLFCDLRRYWDEGNQFCQDTGYDGLATAQDVTENNALAALIESTDQSINSALSYDFAASSFLGYTRSASYQHATAAIDSDGFSWVDGSGPGYTQWQSGEPNGASTGEDCLEYAYNASPRGQWNDVFCFAGQHSVYPSPQRRISCSARP